MSEMTEQQIRDGYERLDRALAPPLDTSERVARRVAVRRRLLEPGPVPPLAHPGEGLLGQVPRVVRVGRQRVRETEQRTRLRRHEVPEVVVGGQCHPFGLPAS
jgi:hypothetical protein